MRKSDDGVASGDLLASWLESSFDPQRFRHKPWQPQAISQRALTNQITDAIESSGSWTTFGELRMGQGPTVVIERAGQEDLFRVTVRYGIVIVDTYRDLPTALGMASLLVDFAVGLDEHRPGR